MALIDLLTRPWQPIVWQKNELKLVIANVEIDKMASYNARARHFPGSKFKSQVKLITRLREANKLEYASWWSVDMRKKLGYWILIILVGRWCDGVTLNSLYILYYNSSPLGPSVLRYYKKDKHWFVVGPVTPVFPECNILGVIRGQFMSRKYFRRFVFVAFWTPFRCGIEILVARDLWRYCCNNRKPTHPVF